MRAFLFELVKGRRARLTAEEAKIVEDCRLVDKQPKLLDSALKFVD